MAAETVRTACPHDCPSGCALEVERIDRRRIAPPARSFLNTSFTESPASRKREGRPTAMVHPAGAAALAIEEGDRVSIGNRRGRLTLHARRFEGMQRGTLVVEGVWPNRAFDERIGINLLVGGDPVPPVGGVAFHDTAVWLRPAGAEPARGNVDRAKDGTPVGAVPA